MSDTGTPPRPSGTARSGTVTVSLEAKEIYILHRALLDHHSGFFRGALSSRFKESDENLVALLEVGAGPFNVFVDWLYSQKLPHQREMWGYCNSSIMAEYQAYVLGDMLIAPAFKLFETLEWHYPCYEEVIYAFEHLPEQDPLLQLLVDAEVINWGIERERDDVDKKYASALPQEFLVRVLQKLNELSHLVRDQSAWYGKRTKK